MKQWLSLMLILLVPLTAASEWGLLPLKSAVETSDLIVIGTLRDVAEVTSNDFDYGVGTITVDEVLWGGAESREKLSLVWKNRSKIKCPRVEHRGHENARAIWLLTLKPGGKVAADHPGRFVTLEKKEKILELLRSAGKM